MPTAHLRSATSAFFIAFSLSVSTALAAGDDRIGVQTHFAHAGWQPISTLDAIRDLGVGWIRDDIFWSSVEKTKGQYEIPPQTWEWIKAAKARDLKILLTITGGNSLYNDPYDKDGYVNFAQFVAKELRGHVEAIEIINEPFDSFRKSAEKSTGGPSSWTGWDRLRGRLQPWAYKYLETMNAVADAIDESAPGTYEIIGLGCAPSLNKLMLREGVSKRITGIALHPYSKKLPPEWLPYGSGLVHKIKNGEVAGDASGSLASINADLLSTSKAHQGPKELWLTEQGYTTYRCESCKSSYASSSEETQAIFAQRRLLENLGTGVRFSSWYNFYDKGADPRNSEHNFGLMRRDGSLKPAYHAIRALIIAMREQEANNWGKAELKPQVDSTKKAKEIAPLQPDQYRAYFFSTPEGDRTVALWSTSTPINVKAPLTITLRIETDHSPNEATLLDLLSGNEKNISFRTEGAAIIVGDLPLTAHPALITFKVQ